MGATYFCLTKSSASEACVLKFHLFHTVIIQLKYCRLFNPLSHLDYEKARKFASSDPDIICVIFEEIKGNVVFLFFSFLFFSFLFFSFLFFSFLFFSFLFFSFLFFSFLFFSFLFFSFLLFYPHISLEFPDLLNVLSDDIYIYKHYTLFNYLFIFDYRAGAREIDLN